MLRCSVNFTVILINITKFLNVSWLTVIVFPRIAVWRMSGLLRVAFNFLKRWRGGGGEMCCSNLMKVWKERENKDVGRKIDRSTNTGAVLVLIIHSAVVLLFALHTQLLQVLTVHSAYDLEFACAMTDSTGGTALKTAPTVGVEVVLSYSNCVATFRVLLLTQLSKEGFSILSLSACPNVVFWALKIGQCDTISPF
jgi:hypothetical protein